VILRPMAELLEQRSGTEVSPAVVSRAMGERREPARSQGSTHKSEQPQVGETERLGCRRAVHLESLAVAQIHVRVEAAASPRAV
jgi:hypothetical protein